MASSNALSRLRRAEETTSVMLVLVIIFILQILKAIAVAEAVKAFARLWKVFYDGSRLWKVRGTFLRSLLSKEEEEEEVDRMSTR
jgi:hypothetical protein